MPNLTTYLDWTPKGKFSKEIGLQAQNLLAIQSPIINIIGGPYLIILCFQHFWLWKIREIKLVEQNIP